jgi:CubicO group peptidase (beta-lactamase class C family)/imidazolonepropionase-like amidohydrolase
MRTLSILVFASLAFAQDKAFINARVVDGTGKTLERATILVHDGRVVSVGATATIPAGAERTDLTGKTVIPGIINAHGHVNSGDQLDLYARYGITTIFSLGGDREVDLRDRTRPAQQAASLSRARLFIAGPIPTSKTADEARKAVDAIAAAHTDIVKFRLDDNLGRTAKMPAEAYTAIIEEAHKKGMRVAVHVVTLADAKAVLRLGADIIAHSVRDESIDDEFIALMKKNRAYYIPTLMREVSTYVYGENPAFLNDPFLTRDGNQTEMAKARESAFQESMRNDKAGQWYKEHLPLAMRNLKKAFDGGVPVAMGTDTGPAYRFQGYFEHLELEQMVKSGLTPMQAIVSATATAARAVNIADQAGTLEPGKWADFLVLDANPLEDIANTRKLASVWIAGNKVPPARPGAALQPAQAALAIDALFSPWARPDTPGASVAVIRKGELIFAKGYGQATLEYPAPIGADTIFHVASVSKQFTAMCLVLLEQDGKLSLEDDIHRYLPELPAYGNPVTIRQLLTHTSGIRDQWQTLALAGWRLDDIITQQQILRVLFRQKELNFIPGTRHLYSNGGYSLAAEIVHRVSGKGFDTFADERIFKPLGMTHTHVHDDVTHVVPGRAYSYSLTNGVWFNAPLNYSNAGATSLFTTAPDLCKWLDNFRDSKVGGAKAIARLQEQAIIDGKPIDYALGVSVGKYRGLRTISHGGSDAGYRTFVVWFPDQQLGIAVLANLGNFNPANLANRVAEIYLESEMQPATPPPAPPARTPPASYEPADLTRYTGTYWSDELETQYTVTLRDGKLIARHMHHGDIALTPTAKDQFHGDAWFTPEVKFVEGGMILGGGRVAGIRFVRR